MPTPDCHLASYPLLVLTLPTAGPHVLRTLPKKVAKPDPQEYLRKNTSSPLQHRKVAVISNRNAWPTNLCPHPKPFVAKDMYVPLASRWSAVYITTETQHNLAGMQDDICKEAEATCTNTISALV